MKNSSTVWTAVLTFTAIILGVILLSAPPREAQGAMLNAQAGFSLMTTGIAGGDEALIIVDKNTQKVIVYAVNGNDLVAVAGRRVP